MPVILRNNATNIELDFNANFKVNINKGDFDVVLSDPGDGSVAMVIVIPRTTAVTDNKFELDWRDISDPLGITSAIQLRDLLLGWNSPQVIVASSVLPDGAATAAKQDLLLTELQKKADMTEAQFTRQTDQYGFISELTPTGEVRTVEPLRLCGTTFSGATVDPNFWAVTDANGGTTTQAGSLLTIATNITTPNGSSILHSIAVSRHVGGSINRYRGQLRLGDTGEVNNSRKWGAFNTNNGAYFELDGLTLYAVTLKNGTPTRVASTLWNGNTTLPTLTNTTTYEIYITAGKVYFVISDVLMHTALFPTVTWTDTTNLPIGMSSVNSNGLQTNHTIEARAVTIYRLGKSETIPRYYHLAGNAATHILKYGPGILHKIVFNNTSGTSITLIDNFTGATPVMGLITTSAGALGEWDYSIPFNTGLTIITVGNGLDATIMYE